MAAVVADTHAVVWYLLQHPSLSVTARAALRQASLMGEPIYLSAISIIEVVYLIEKGKLAPVALDRLSSSLLENGDVALVLAPVDIRVATALQQIPRAQVPDMPDRIIAATALALDVPLVSRDRKIQAAPLRTIW